MENSAGRERLLLDFGWRFHLGNADDPSKDFGFGNGRSGSFQKTGNFLPAGALAFDDGDWTPINLPHDWAVELPFVNDPGLASKGFHPLGRNYPETSVGWYRRVLELDAADAGKRISLEFDGSYRETMVVFNGFYSAATVAVTIHSGLTSRTLQIPAVEMYCWSGSMPPRPMAGSTRALASIAMSGWLRRILCTSSSGEHLFVPR